MPPEKVSPRLSSAILIPASDCAVPNNSHTHCLPEPLLLWVDGVAILAAPHAPRQY